MVIKMNALSQGPDPRERLYG